MHGTPWLLANPATTLTCTYIEFQAFGQLLTVGVTECVEGYLSPIHLDKTKAIMVREVKLQRQRAVRHLVKSWLVSAPCLKNITWGTPALIRALLILTYDGCIHLLLENADTNFHLTEFVASLSKIVPGLTVCYYNTSMAIALPGVNVDFAKLMIIDEAMFVPGRGGQSKTEDYHTHTLAAIWLTAIDATSRS